MEDDKTGDNEKELTSTSSPMGKLLSTNSDEKNDSNDTLPTSSTDANTSSKSSQSVSDDPISSTSNEMDSSKIKSTADPPPDVADKASTFDTDAELLGMSINAESHEKIEENVDDLVNDLETLLGESTDSFTIPTRSTVALEQKTEAVELEVDSLPNQKAEDEVSSNTDVAGSKSVPLDLPNDLNLLHLKTEEAVELSQDSADEPSQKCNSDEVVELESSVSVTPSEPEAIAAESETIHKNADDEQPTLKVPIEGEELSSVVELMGEEETPEESQDVSEEIPESCSEVQAAEMIEGIAEAQPSSENNTAPNMPTPEEMLASQELPHESDIICEAEAPADPQQEAGNVEDITDMQPLPENNVAPNTDAEQPETSAEEPQQEAEIVEDIVETVQPVEPLLETDLGTENLENITLQEESSDKKSEEVHQPDETSIPIEESNDVGFQFELPDENSNEAPEVEETVVSAVSDSVSAQIQVASPESTPLVEGNLVKDSLETENVNIPMETDDVSETLPTESADLQSEEQEDVSSLTEVVAENVDEVPMEGLDSQVTEAVEITELAESDVPSDNTEILEVDPVVQEPEEAIIQPGEVTEEQKDDGIEEITEIDAVKADSTEESEQIEESHESPKPDTASSEVSQSEEVPVAENNMSEDIQSNESAPEVRVIEGDLCENTQPKESEPEEIASVDGDLSEDIQPKESEPGEVPPVVESSLSEDLQCKESEVEEVPPLVESSLSEDLQCKESEVEEVPPLVESTLSEDFQCKESEAEEVPPLVESSLSEDIQSRESEAEEVAVVESNLGDNTQLKESESEELPVVESNLSDNIQLEKPELEEAPVEESIELKLSEPEEIPVDDSKLTDTIPTVECETADILDHETKPAEGDEVTTVKENAEVAEEPSVKIDGTLTPDEFTNLVEDSPQETAGATESVEHVASAQPEELNEAAKTCPEINIRRKTVEQDLEKVVCLSEESSDSDDAAPAPTTAKYVEEEQPFVLDQLLDSEMTQDMPGIEDILSTQPKIPAVEERTSSFETMLAVASLQNETVSSGREERRLSDKEIQDMEAIRMAVASITDSSQDTYDSFLVDSAMPLDNDLQQVTENSVEGLVSEDAMQADSVFLGKPDAEQDAETGSGEAVCDTSKGTEEVCGLDTEVAAAVETEAISSEKEVSSTEIALENEVKRESESVAEEAASGDVLETEVPDIQEVEKSNPPSEPVQSSLCQPKENAVLVEDEPSEKSPQIDEAPSAEPEGKPELNVTPAEKRSEEQVNALDNNKMETEVPDLASTKAKVEHKPDTVSTPDAVVTLTEEPKETAKQSDVMELERPTQESKEVAKKSEAVVLQRPTEEIHTENSIFVTVSESKDAATLPNKQTTTEDRPLRSRTRRGNKVSEPLSISVEEVEKKEVCSPKITIKPIKAPEEDISASSTSEADTNKGSLKITITKQSDKMHSILKVYNPDEEEVQEEPIPKLIIKPKMQQVEQQPQQQHSPKMTTRSSKGYSPTSPRCSSPRVTIKPVTKPVEAKSESVSSLKITFKPVETIRKHSPKLLKEMEKNHSPKITIKPIPKPTEVEKDEAPATPKVTIKPIKRHAEDAEIDVDQERSSPKITIKPVVKPPDHDSDQTAQSTPKLKIKPIKKHDDEESVPHETEHGSPKISIKPVVKPPEQEEEETDDVKERIVLKINRGNLPASTKDSKKREYPEDDKAEKVGIKLKFSTTGGHTHIIQDGEESNKRQRKDSGYSSSAATKRELEDAASLKRPLDEKLPEKNKRLRNSTSPDKATINNDLSAKAEPLHETPPAQPHDISKITDLASQTTHIGASPVLTVGVATPAVQPPTPKRRGRPRKVPLQVREEFSTPEISPAPSAPSSDVETPPTGVTPPVGTAGGRPKRSCRGQNVIATLGIKPRKPRGRGRGSKVNMGDREPPPAAVQAPPAEPTPMETEPVKPKKEDNPENGNEEAGPSKKEVLPPPPEETPVKKDEEKKADSEEPQATPPAKKRGAPRKLEVTTRRKKAQLQKGEVEKAPEPPKKEEPTPEVTTEPTETVAATPQEANPKKLSPAKRLSEKSEEATVEKKPKLEQSILEKHKELLEKKEPHENEIEIITIEDDSKNPDDIEDEEESSEGGDSENDKRREYVLQRKQEAIKKCRAKRMEKLARAAEVKKKRQEQAAQQREARKAAEEAEKAAAERSRATKRYGRYGVPKPQISLIDAPVPETDGTVKAHTVLSNAGVAPQPVTEDENSDRDRPGPSTPLKSSGQSSESMVVDPLEETPVKLRGSIGSEDVVMLDEETRMSADLRGSRAHTPAKQGVSDVIVEDSQGSVGTEGGKSRSLKTPKMEVFQDLEAVFTADQLAEYSWNGQGPFMLQEQVTHFLGIKSFKRKYPNATRRPVDMQERDYLKENNLVTEGQCDLGLTAVLAQDILDIMYTDFQDKYEDYCRAQREKQARELADKQRALNQVSLKPGFDKLDILEQAVQSVASWNQQFNKARRDQRKAYMDLQNLTIHYPKSKMKVIPAPKAGHYPVALVPGQFIDYYKEYTPTELNNLPLNTMCYDEIKIPGVHTDSDDSSSGSESDSDSDSSSSGSGSCDDDNCKDCAKKGKKSNGVRETDSDDVVIIENDASSSDSVVLVSVTEAIRA